MRHLRDLPDEEIIIASGSEILELVVNATMGDDHPEPPTPFGTPSLHDLYDLEVDVPEDDPNEKAVNDLFSDAALLAAEEASSPSSDSDSSLHTPRHDRGEKEIPGLKWEKMDLRCYEECLPPSDDEDEQAIQNAASHGVQAVSESFALDCPPLPGHGCKSCEFHRINTGDKAVLCALCYMRAYNHCVYSPVSDADDETPTTESTLSPPEIGTSPSDNIVRPVPVRATGRRAAVECLDDLLQGGDEPLDLCTRKRPRH
uniref:Early E1A protein n=1 Tax=Human adenovirus E serotype 4 TaxID=28280 RepID=E1A_ADE04|nr:RecName: Full=Early E1A protein; AltName: Full=Early E1A 28 kDa protein [Human adenovirus E4]AAA67091.1 E1A [Human adenovirus E4]